MRSISILLFLLSLLIPLEGKFKIAAYPQFSYAEDTGFLAGVISYSKFQFKNFPKHIPKQKLTVQAVYTSKKQLSLMFEPFLFTKETDYMSLKLNLPINIFPPNFMK